MAYVGHRAGSVLNYRWNWSPIPQFFVRWDEQRGLVANLLLQGLCTTLRLAVWSMVLASILGGVVGLARVSRHLLPRWLGLTYVELMRNTPPLVVVFVGYFFVTSQIMPLLGLDEAVRSASPGTQVVLSVLFGDPHLLSNLLSGVVCLALFEGAYVAEILRAGIQSVAQGQWDGATALGLTRGKALRLIVLPQAIARMVPPLCGQFISLVKDSSIVSLISIQELTFMSNEVAVSTTRVFETWISTSAVYFALCFALSDAAHRFELRLVRRRS
ncbi:MAG: amino acid ABC transporter permease [Janthinobacterium lividum]